MRWKEALEVMDMFIAQIVVLGSQMYTNLQTQVAYAKYVQLFVCQSHFNKVLLLRKKKKSIYVISSLPTCPDQKSNLQPFSRWDNTPTNLATLASAH